MDWTLLNNSNFQHQGQTKHNLIALAFLSSIYASLFYVQCILGPSNASLCFVWIFQYSNFPHAGPHLSGSKSQNTSMNNLISVRLVTPPFNGCCSPSLGLKLSLGIAGMAGGSGQYTPHGCAWPCLAKQWVQWGCIWFNTYGVDACICATHLLKP